MSKAIGAQFFAPLSHFLTPECTSQAAVRPHVHRGQQKGRERVVTGPQVVPVCFLELTSPQPRMTLGCAHSPGETAAPSEPLWCYVQTCTEPVLRRAGGSHLPSAFWFQVFYQECLQGYRERGPAGCGVSILELCCFCYFGWLQRCWDWDLCLQGVWRDLVAPFNSLDLLCCPLGAAAKVKSCIWTWVAGWDLAWASPCLPSCLCPAPLRAFTALVIKVGHLNLIYCLFPQFASEGWGYFVHDVCLEPW